MHSIGILMQEFIAAQVTREAPEDWVQGALLEGNILGLDPEDEPNTQEQMDEDDKEDEEVGDGLHEEDEDKEDEEDVPHSSDDEKSSSESDAVD